ncbi:hypothetical protein DFR40_0144 [Azonexus fungiphilus]|uniref:Uncharacterized protein n=1 Tax=Azonexus fungiphilus TaxID=146940 RepID=A0A495WPX7_9RHOO|nr:hypothetical protein [Azonexus fungiphilus]RKT63094.1 hypothetical protein DFR40_0144 [Azonexus fungiphilus]
MNMKQSIKHGQQIDISNRAAKQRSGDSESCRTNKPVNSINITNSSHSNVSNTEYINTGISHDSSLIANAVHTVLTTVVCDGLNLTAHIDESDQIEFESRLMKYSGPLKLKNAPKMMPYRQGRVIYDGDKAIAQIRYKPIGNAGYFLLHVNPSKLDSGQSQLIQGLVSYLLGEPWCSFVGRAKASMFDAAVDVHGINIASIIPVPSRATQSGFFLKFFQKGLTRLYQQGTEYVGHNTSEKHATVYDKADERSEVIGVSGSEDVTRVEVQAKPRVRRKLGEEVTTLAELPAYENPLRMLSIAELPKDAEQDDFLRIATALTAYVGATAVLQLIGDKTLQDCLKGHLVAPPCSWWQPEKHWVEFLIGLASHPLFAPCKLLNEPAYLQVANQA